MKRLFIFLMTISFGFCALAEEPDSSQNKDLFVPWKPEKKETYRDKNLISSKQRAGMSVNEYLGVEGARLDFNYEDIYRYSPLDDKGYSVSDYAVNLLGVGKLPLSDFFTLFAKAGPSYYKTFDETLDPIAIANNPQDWGLAYSTGARLNLAPNLQLSLEYMQTDTDELETEGGFAQINWGF